MMAAKYVVWITTRHSESQLICDDVLHLCFLLPQGTTLGNSSIGKASVLCNQVRTLNY